jgi:hypothetical protein
MKAKITTLVCTSLAVLLSATASRADEDGDKEHGSPSQPNNPNPGP